MQGEQPLQDLLVAQIMRSAVGVEDGSVEPTTDLQVPRTLMLFAAQVAKTPIYAVCRLPDTSPRAYAR